MTSLLYSKHNTFSILIFFQTNNPLKIIKKYTKLQEKAKHMTNVNKDIKKALSITDLSLEETMVKLEKKNESKQQTKFIEDGCLEVSLFKNQPIRKIFHNNEWFYSIIDIIAIITKTDRPSKYWNDLKDKLLKIEGFFDLSDKIGKLKMIGADGKKYPTEAADAETIFRIIQSIPSPNAEPFKRWFARIAYERIQEIQNPEIGARRIMMFYKAKGYSDEWINNRIKTIAARKELTDEWQRRGITTSGEFAILTNIINKETFDKDVQAHKALKGLNKTDELRDHMTPIELALTMLAETSTKEFAQRMDAQGMKPNAEAAKKGGEVGKAARISIERKLGKSVVSETNYLTPKQKQMRLENKNN